MDKVFITSVQNFIANAFSISTVRRMGPPGTLECIRRFLKERVNLAAISKKDASKYARTLDDLTEKLQQAMPKGAQNWGVARKCLNLFFRDALYNFYLRREYGLEKLEDYLEIPLDSNVGHALRQEGEGAHLLRWRTVKGLKREESAKFQAVAAEVAKRHRTKRVHLDVVYWRREKTSAAAQTKP